jgi:hypothetical protein
LFTASIPWIFPLAWIAGNCLQTGDPLHFLHTIRTYKSTWYGGGGSYLAYLQTFFRIDPYATVIGALGIAASVVLYMRRKALVWFVLMATAPFVAFVCLHGPQVEPPGNYVRYLGPFLFVIYPIVGMTTEIGVKWVARSQAASRALLALVALGIVGSQIYTTFHFTNDPAADGLEVGQRIRALRQQHPGTHEYPVLIELSYWQYLAVHVGANDVSNIIYDRPLDLEWRQSRSIFLSDERVIRNGLSLCRVSYVIVKSSDLRRIVQHVLKAQPEVEVNGYAFYPVPSDLGATPGGRACPLVFGTGY